MCIIGRLERLQSKVTLDCNRSSQVILLLIDMTSVTWGECWLVYLYLSDLQIIVPDLDFVEPHGQD